MGGDHGPHVTVPAALDFRRANADVELILVGLRDAIDVELAKHGAAPGPGLRVQHAGQAVAMDEPPVQALRFKKDSSMRVAVNLVKGGEAHACVSAGNTGALMAISRFVLKTLPAIDRPAIASGVPNSRGGYTYILDLGANVDCTPEQLMQFGVMGAMLVAAVEHKERPSVGLLNIGIEDIKGNDTVKQAAELLRGSGLNFHGNVEADDIYKGSVDVVVCDGFVGNIMLKSWESLVNFFRSMLKEELTANPLRATGALLSKGAFNAFKERVNPERYSGAPLLGLNGNILKAHGSSNRRAIRSAIIAANEIIKAEMNQRIESDIARANELLLQPT